MTDMKRIFLFFCLTSQIILGQVGIGTNAPEASAVLDLSSTTQGFLPPRMTNAQMTAIASPALGLMMYCSDCEPQGIYYYDGSNFLNSITSVVSGNLNNFDGSSLVHNGGDLDATIPYVETNEITSTVLGRGWSGDVYNTISFNSTGRLGYTATLINLEKLSGLLEVPGLIPDAQLSASSVANAAFVASNGRLNSDTSWAVSTANTSQWFEVDLGQLETVLGVATQGRPDGPNWIETYRIQYSTDGVNYTLYNFGASFAGNNDQDTVVRNDFSVPISARYVRFLPQTWEGFIVSRFEVYIVSTPYDVATFQITGKAAASSGPNPSFNVSVGGQSLIFSRIVN